MPAPRFSRRALLGTGSAGLAAAAVASRTVAGGDAAAAAATAPANILLITLDDLGAETPSCFGGRPGITPNIDRLATQSTVFDRAHVPVALCQPSRSALMTGLFPHRNGAVGFGPVRDDVVVLTDLLRARGYRTGILSKVDHLQPMSRYGWDLLVDSGGLGAGRNPGAYAAQARGFFATAKSRRQPFFLMVNSDDPHRPFSGSADERAAYNDATLASMSAPSQVYDAASVTVPGFLPDLPGVRTELAQYESSTRRADDTVGAVMRELEASGLAATTVVVLLGDNGMPFPFAKSNCYRQSTRTPMMVRWPGVSVAGRRESTAFVSTLDLFPTLARVAGATVPAGLDGQDLTPLLKGQSQTGRTELHTVFHETGAGVRFEMRSTLNSRWSYLWNPWSDGSTSYRVEYLNSLSWQGMLAAAQNDPALRARTDLFLRRVPEELYDLSTDPHSLRNLVSQATAVPSSAAGQALTQLRSSTAAWMQAKADPLRPAYVAAVPQAG